MKKNMVIAILVLVSVFSLAYAYQQKVKADRYKAMAEENERLAREQLEAARRKAEMEWRRAEAAYQESMKRLAEAERKK